MKKSSDTAPASTGRACTATGKQAGGQLTLSTHGGRKGTTNTLGEGGVYRNTGIVWVGVVLSVLGHAWCLRWAELHIETAGIDRRTEAPD